MKILVSIVMPVYNGERFIAEAIDSILAQTYGKWELIVINDGSTDDSIDFVSSVEDPRVRLFHQKNRGLACARNAGIEQARGAYLAFLDADDAWLPGFLARCVGALQADPTLGGVYTLGQHIDEKGRVLPQPAGQCVTPERLHDKLLEGSFLLVNAAVVKASVVRGVGGFDSNLRGQGSEDWDLWLRISQVYPMECIPEALARYRVYPGTMATNTAKMHACRLSVLRKHFGSAGVDARTWEEGKQRAYGFAYRTAAIGHLRQRELEKGWQCLGQAAAFWPPLLGRLDTFYELALGDQPRGYRGEATRIDIATNGTQMLDRLDQLLASATADVQALRRVAHSNAYLALAMLSDQAGQWGSARRYMFQALLEYPGLLRRPGVARRLMKLFAGKSVVRGLHRLWLRADHQMTGQGQS